MTRAPHGLPASRDGPRVPGGIATHATRVEFTSIQITLFLFIAVTISIGIGFMTYLFLYHEGKQKPQLDRRGDDHWMWSRENPSNSPLHLLERPHRLNICCFSLSRLITGEGEHTRPSSESLSFPVPTNDWGTFVTPAPVSSSASIHNHSSVKLNVGNVDLWRSLVAEKARESEERSKMHVEFRQ
jgi:hypothetical protein